MCLRDGDVKIKCRSCGDSLFKEPLLVLEGVPKAAQFFLEHQNAEDNDAVDLSVFQCKKCGLVQLMNEPVSYYRDVITSARWSDKMYSFRQKQLQDFIDKYALLNKKVIEFGCGEGYLLDILEKCGVRATGIENSEKSVLNGREKGRTIVKGYIADSYQDIKEKYDAFVCINFVEHAPQPNAFLQGIFQCLTEDAVGLIEVPNLEKVIEKKRYYDFIADHLSYFTKETLCFLLQKNGFEVIECYSTWEADDLVAIVRKRKMLPIKKEFEVLCHLMIQLKQIVFSYKKENKRVAVWGASHQSMTLLSLCDFNADDLEYVIDSALHKQGKYVPVIRVPILAPDYLYHNPVDLVIVMAAGYSDEVITILKGMGIGTRIAVLNEQKIEFVG